MLTGIVLKDYTTFKNETIFDFKTTNYKILESTNVGDNRILKGALLVGENASGKTQVLKAIVLLLDILLSNKEINLALKKSMYTKGTKYSIKYFFNIKNTDIEYDIEIDKNEISLEKLYVDGKIKIERLKNSGKIYLTDDKDIEVDKTLSIVKLEYYNTRFDNNSLLNEWFDYLKNSIYINCIERRIKMYNPTRISEQSLEKYAEKKDASKLNQFIDNLGYNSEIVFNKESFNEDKTMTLVSKEEMIGLKKKGTDVVMPLLLESSGNQAFMNIILPIQFATKNNCMLIIDEFSSGLHNEFEEALIKYFFNNSKNSQLFFTSHSTNLLDTYILRPDQIYSFKFDPEKGTLIKRFSDENPRESQNIEKMYLNGVFDGMPEYDKTFKD